MIERVVRAVTRWDVPEGGNANMGVLPAFEERKAFYRARADEALVGLVMPQAVAERLVVSVWRARVEHESECLVGWVPGVMFADRAGFRLPFHGVAQEGDEYEIRLMNTSHVELYVALGLWVDQP